MKLSLHVVTSTATQRYAVTAKRAAQSAFETIPRKVRQKLLGDEDAFLVVAFVTDKEMRTLNQQYRKKDKTTDVLSFSRFDDTVPMPVPPGEPRPVGEVLVSFAVAKKQAKEYGTTLRDEISRLVAHGTLHIFGYDHETSQADAKVMFRLQATALRRIRASRPARS